MAHDIHLFPYMADNYGVLIRDPDSGACACVDAGDGQAVLDALEKTGWTLSQLWITHWHTDHTDGIAKVKAATGAEVIGPGYDSGIAGLDHTVRDGDRLSLGALEVEVWHTPGHSLDMVNYHLPAEGLMFAGDTLFTLGCGRVFEGTKPQMWESLSRFLSLPDDTIVYGAHEYTLANAAFALTVDPENAALRTRAEAVQRTRDAGQPTVPTTIGEERATNPFLRPADPGIRAHLGMDGATDAEVFTRIRTLKDQS
ncbi:MAG: hydroxyacylglutathione hydrolase [Shimia sp.]